MSDVEELKGEKREKAIVFTLGLILVECLTMEAPFCLDVDEVAHQRVCDGEIPSLDMIYDEQESSVVQTILTTDPQTRPSLHTIQLLLHSLLTSDESNTSDYLEPTDSSLCSELL